MIPTRFNGPPGSGNGGYCCGLVAAHLGAGPARVRLRLPPPLERPLQLRREQGSALLVDGDAVVAEASPTSLDADVPEPVDHSAAVAALEAFDVDGYGAAHAFATCFTCGPGRAPGDGLRIFPAVVADRPELAVSPWSPHPSFADADGFIRDEILWAALDCPSGLVWITRDPATGPAVLGELAVDISRRVVAEEPLVVTAWQAGAQGRKRTSGSALWDAEGSLVAHAEATWIVLDESHHRSFGVRSD